MNWFWLILALLAASGSGGLTAYAYRTPKGEPYPDWFWGGDTVEVGWVKTLERIDRQESEPTSGAD